MSILAPYEELDLAINIASNKHYGQTDKGGKPYILHTMHVMNELMYDPQLAAVGVLHDVLEDTDVVASDLRDFGFSERVVAALVLLDHSDDSPYDEYIERVCTNYDAVRVKRKDVDHNSRVTRLKGLREKDFKRLEKYARTYTRLGEAKKEFQKRL